MTGGPSSARYTTSGSSGVAILRRRDDPEPPPAAGGTRLEPTPAAGQARLELAPAVDRIRREPTSATGRTRFKPTLAAGQARLELAPAAGQTRFKPTPAVEERATIAPVVPLERRPKDPRRVTAPERPERIERPGRPEQPEQPGRPEGIERPERIERIEQPERVGSPDRRAAGLQAVRQAGLAGLVRPASEHTPDSLGAQRVLPVPAEFRPLLPAGGLRRGTTVAVRSSSALLALLSAASQAGSWCAVVGMPQLNPVAAAELGIALERLAFVPYPGTHWTTAVAALLDGFDLVVAAPPGPIAPSVASRLAARARQRGSVLLPAGPLCATWSGADLTVEAVRGEWTGLGAGRGRLRARELTVRAWGRGSASAPREITVSLPALTGPLPPVQGQGQGQETGTGTDKTTPDDLRKAG